MGYILGRSLLWTKIINQHVNADCILRLPVAVADKDIEVDPETFNMFCMAQIEPLLVINALVP